MMWKILTEQIAEEDDDQKNRKVAEMKGCRSETKVQMRFGDLGIRII